MTEDAKEKSKKPIGSISEYKTLGSKHAKIQTSVHSDVDTSLKPDLRKSKHPDWVQRTYYIPPDLAKWLNVFAAQSEMEVSEVVAQSLREFRDKHK